MSNAQLNYTKATTTDVENFNKLTSEYFTDRVNAHYNFLISGDLDSGKEILLTGLLGMCSCNESLHIADCKSADEPKHCVAQGIDDYVIREIRNNLEAMQFFQILMSPKTRVFSSMRAESVEEGVRNLVEKAKQVSEYNSEKLFRILSSMPIVYVHLTHFSIDEILETAGWDKRGNCMKFMTVYRK